MATSSANDIITRAMVKAKIISPGEQAPAAKVAQVFDDLNDMLESWALSKLMVYASVLESFALVAGQSEYTYGDGGDFDSDRPIRILNDNFIRSGGTDFGVKVVTLDIYRNQKTKLDGARPVILAYNPEFPLFRVFLWPTPASTDSIHLKAWKQLTEFTDRTTSINLPPGYRRAIVLNLAVEISPAFGKSVSIELAALAAGSKKEIKGSNATPAPRMTTDLRSMTGGGRGGSIQSGPFG